MATQKFFHLSTYKREVGEVVPPRAIVHRSTALSNRSLENKKGFFVSTLDSILDSWIPILIEYYPTEELYLYEVLPLTPPVRKDVYEDLHQWFVEGPIQVTSVLAAGRVSVWERYVTNLYPFWKYSIEEIHKDALEGALYRKELYQETAEAAQQDYEQSVAYMLKVQARLQPGDFGEDGFC